MIERNREKRNHLIHASPWLIFNRKFERIKCKGRRFRDAIKETIWKTLKSNFYESV